MNGVRSKLNDVEKKKLMANKFAIKWMDISKEKELNEIKIIGLV